MSDLREYTKLKYVGDCKCGKCQLIPLEKITESVDALETMREALQAIAEPGKWDAANPNAVEVIQMIAKGALRADVALAVVDSSTIEEKPK